MRQASRRQFLIWPSPSFAPFPVIVTYVQIEILDALKDSRLTSYSSPAAGRTDDIKSADLRINIRKELDY